MKSNERMSWLPVIKCAGAFAALFIGSGFATGQEAMQFFTAYGYKGILGGLITLFFFMYLNYKFMDLGLKKGITRNEDVFKHFLGKWLGVGVTWYTMVFIVAIFAIMLAGAGATLEQSYGLPSMVGSGIMTAACIFVILLGLNKLIDVLGFIGPVIIVVTLFIAIATLISNPSGIAEGNDLVGTLTMYKASPYWWLSGFLYVGLGALPMASFIPSVGRSMGSMKEMTAAAVAGPFIFIAALVLVALALLSQVTMVNGTEIPILTLADNVLPIYGSLFAIIICLGIFSTAAPLLLTVVARFFQEKTKGYKILTVVLALIGYLGGSLLPFGQLVNLIFPTVGYVGAILIASVIFEDVRNLVQNKPNKDSVREAA